MSGKCSSYMANFKLQVIAFDKSSNNSMAAHHFSVNEKQVREWRKKCMHSDYFSCMFFGRNKRLYISQPPYFRIRKNSKNYQLIHGNLQHNPQ